MALAETVGPQLPYLRRFARALTGNQLAGDAYAAATLEAIVNDPDCFDRSLPLRVALYRVFFDVWNGVGHTGIADILPVSAVERAVVSNLKSLAPCSRVVFVLHTVEEFSLDQIALVIRRSSAETAALLAEAGMDILDQIATKVLIIEDEPVIALDLEALVTDLGHDVIGIARTHKEAIELIQSEKPGLVLADFQLADGSSGLNATNEILGDISIPVIFITAFPEQLLTGTTIEPIFLLTKPFRADIVKATISQALFFGQNSRPLPLRRQAI